MIAALDDEGLFYPLNNFSFIEEKAEGLSLKYLITILNSTMMNFYFKNVHIDYNIKPKYIEKLPIKNISQHDQTKFIDKAENILSLNKMLHDDEVTFLSRVKGNLDLQSLSKKIDSFYDYDFITFLNEIKKKGVTLSLLQQDEWENYFSIHKTRINELQEQIMNTDKTIDEMVYELYNLKDKDISVIEREDYTV